MCSCTTSNLPPCCSNTTVRTLGPYAARVQFPGWRTVHSAKSSLTRRCQLRRIVRPLSDAASASIRDDNTK